MTIADQIQTRKIRIFYGRLRNFLAEGPQPTPVKFAKEYEAWLGEWKKVDKANPGLVYEIIKRQVILHADSTMVDHLLERGIKHYHEYIEKETQLFLNFWNYCIAYCSVFLS